MWPPVLWGATVRTTHRVFVDGFWMEKTDLTN